MSKASTISLLTKLVSKVGHSLSKNSPVIFTALGVAGIGATSYLAYKSKDKVETIVEKIESNTAVQVERELIESELNDTTLRLTDAEFAEKQNQLAVLNETKPYTRLMIVRDVAGAVAAPVIVGTLSIASIILSYQIQNNRIGSLAAALATSTTENMIFKKKYKEKHGEEEYVQFSNTVQQEVTELKNGKEKKKIIAVPDERDSLTEYWYEDSEYFVKDDSDYNDAFIHERVTHLESILYHRGAITLNQALDTLGLQTKKAGAIVGWTLETFNVEVKNVRAYDTELAEEVMKPIIVFTQPEFIYANKNVLLGIN